MRKTTLCLAILATTAISTAANAALPVGFTVSVEAPGVQNTTATLTNSGVETFDSRSHGVQNFNTSFGGSPITATYTGVNVIGADQYGGSNGNTNYAVTGLGVSNSYAIDFNQGVNYFGYWLSALDGANTVEFWSGANKLGTFNPTEVLALVGGNSAYFGNPNSPFQGNNAGEPYAFINFFLNDQEGTFDKVVFTQPNNAGYESDNHTVGFWQDHGGGTVIPGVPEPSTWLTMIAGFGLVGVALRRSKQAKIAIA